MTPSFSLQPHLDQLHAKAAHTLAFRAQTLEEFAEWQHALRAKLKQLLGIERRHHPSIIAKKLGAVDRGDYTEEKYQLDVDEGVSAPIYLLIPKGTPPPFKPLLVFHGHDPSAQYVLGNYPDTATAREQLARENNYAQAFARAGYLVCVVEQRGFGERLTHDTTSDSFPRSCRHLSFEYLLRGRTLLGERCWDGMCALDYLQTRSDLKQGALGCTGHSGGGTTALWLTALDTRITVSVVAGYFSSFNESILGMPHCECNYVPHILQWAEMGDIAALIAPRPLCLLNGELDPLFPIHAAREQFETVKQAYSLHQASGSCSLSVHDGEHVYHHALAREWFEKNY